MAEMLLFMQSLLFIVVDNEAATDANFSTCVSSFDGHISYFVHKIRIHTRAVLVVVVVVAYIRKLFFLILDSNLYCFDL